MITINATNIPIKVDEHKNYKMNLYKKELIGNHVRLAYKVSNEVYYKTYPRQRGIHTRKDINSVGLHGLVRAAQKFKPELGFKFTTYAYPWIYWSCRNFLHRSSLYEELQYYDIPEYYDKEPNILLDDLDDVSRYILENYYGKHLTLKDLAVELGVTVYTVTKWRDKALLHLKI
jgi:RNA polymerase sigma factor (sigma-70 family)